MEKDTKKRKIKISGIFLGIVLLVMMTSLIILVNIIGIIPDNLLIIGVFILILFNIILFFLLVYRFNNKFFKILQIILYIISLIIMVLYSFGIYYLNNTMNFFENISLISEDITNYYIVVLNDSIYQEPSDLYQKTLAYFDNTDKEIIDSIKLDLEYTNVLDVNLLKDKLYNGDVEAILISDIIKNKFEDDDLNFSNNIRIIKTISISKEIEDITKRVSIKNTPFNVLISGIDSYGDINNTSRNDVNIVVTINPNTNEILLTSIPRDYYIQLHGTTGYKDKLTHASYYGTNMVVETIEDILNIDINYYVKVNFTTVEDLVDTLGGIDVYADQALKFCNINVGMNHLNGKCSLRFARERYAYLDGDRHRGRNQQEVIKGIFNKVTSGTAIITEYTEILEILDGKFATNMDINEVTNLLKYELNDLSGYTIHTTQLDGYGSSGKTYSYPTQDLWIMIPYEETIENAHNLINKMLNNESIK